MTPPPPVLTCGELAGACSPSWPLDELLLPAPVESPASLDEPEPDDEPLLLEELLPLLDELLPLELLVVAAWLAPGRMATTTPAAATLATVTVTVAAFSLRRPCSRSATARHLALPRGRGLFLPVVHVIQGYFPWLRIPPENG